MRLQSCPPVGSEAGQRGRCSLSAGVVFMGLQSSGCLTPGLWGCSHVGGLAVGTISRPLQLPGPVALGVAARGHAHRDSEGLWANDGGNHVSLLEAVNRGSRQVLPPRPEQWWPPASAHSEQAPQAPPCSAPGSACGHRALAEILHETHRLRRLLGGQLLDPLFYLFIHIWKCVRPGS